MLSSSTIKKSVNFSWIEFFISCCDHTRADYVSFHKDNFSREAI